MIPESQMRISHKYKFVYIAITKTGSTTVRYLLNKYSDVRSVEGRGEFGHHVTAESLKKTFQKNGWSWDDYFKFTVVRNPAARLYSMYKYKIRIGSNPPTEYMKGYLNFYNSCVELKEMKITFNDAVVGGKVGIQPQINWISSSEKQQLLLDEFIKIEELELRMPSVWKRLGLHASDLNQIPRLNESPGETDWRTLLGNEAMAKIKNYFSLDFELLNY